MPEPAPTPWLRPPRLRTKDSEEDHRVTWTELFFDLIFVAAVGQVAAGLVRDHSATGFVDFVAVLVPVIWAWMGFTFYVNRYDTDDLIHRLTMVAAMAAVAALAVSSRDATSTNTEAFALSYAAVRIVLLCFYLRAYRNVDGRAKQVAGRFLIAFSFAVVLWVIAAFLSAPACFWLWGAALACEMLAPVVVWRVLGSTPIHAAHIEERFGLFTIIVLGEAVLAVVVGTHLDTEGAQAGLVALMTFLCAVAAWWIYFDFADTSILRQAQRGLVYVYAHFPLFAGLAMFGAGAELAIEGAGGDALDAGTRWALCGGLALFLIALSILHAVGHATVRELLLLRRLLSVGALIALAAAGTSLDPLVLSGAAAAVLIAQLIAEARSDRVPASA